MRWSWIVALVLVSAACGSTGVHQAAETVPSTERPARPGGPSPEQAVRPTVEPPAAGSARRPVAEWLRVGGLMGPGLPAVRPPKLVVYADGRAIADAAHELRLPPAEVKALVEALDHDLAGQPATASPRPGTTKVLDAPGTILGVDDGGGMREVHAPYMELAADAYAPALVHARDRLAHLAGRVAAQGRSYSTDRVRLYAERVTTSTTDAEPWPEGVPLPPDPRPLSTIKNYKDYKGNKAFAIARQIPRDGPWHMYRTPSGQQVALLWQYLLPHE